MIKKTFKKSSRSEFNLFVFLHSEEVPDGGSGLTGVVDFEQVV